MCCAVDDGAGRGAALTKCSSRTVVDDGRGAALTPGERERRLVLFHALEAAVRHAK